MRPAKRSTKSPASAKEEQVEAPEPASDAVAPEPKASDIEPTKGATREQIKTILDLRARGGNTGDIGRYMGMHLSTVAGIAERHGPKTGRTAINQPQTKVVESYAAKLEAMAVAAQQIIPVLMDQSSRDMLMRAWNALNNSPLGDFIRQEKKNGKASDHQGRGSQRQQPAGGPGVPADAHE
jgi:hypothetical protein